MTEIKTVKISQALENKMFRKILEITTSELDLKRILREVVKIVTEITKADSVFIYLFDERKRNLVLWASKTPHKKELGEVHLRGGEGITGWVAKNNRPVAISKNAYRDTRFKSFSSLPEDKYEAFLSVPIVNKKKTIGVINVQHKRSHNYAANTVSLMDLIAKQVGGVIENARLYEENKIKATQFDSLMKVSHSLTSESYLDEILNLIVVVSAEMLNSKICSIMLLDRKGKELVIKATQSLSDNYKGKPNLKVNESISGDVVRNKKPIAIYDVRKEKKYFCRDLAVQENLTSMLSVPMVVKDKAIGLINVYTKEPHVFVQEEINVLQIIANQAAVAVENTKLMASALEAREALETRKTVERAKVVLMRLKNLKEEEAYRLMHKKSMDSRRSIKEIAESILMMQELERLNLKPRSQVFSA